MNNKVRPNMLPNTIKPNLPPTSNNERNGNSFKNYQSEGKKQIFNPNPVLSLNIRANTTKHGPIK
jgi:hypothetical protein